MYLPSPRCTGSTSKLLPSVSLSLSWQRLNHSFTGQIMASDGSAKGDKAVAKFHEYLVGCKRVIALSGAGLSAASGLATFRGAGGLWRSHDATSLATPGAFNRDPALVWRFYSYRRHKAMQADPNAAHYALAELARRLPGFQHLSQNVDGLSQRADHPREQLQLLHGTLFEVKCNSKVCDYKEENFVDPIVPALDIPHDSHDPTTNKALGKDKKGKELDISDASVKIADIPREDLPQCPRCKKDLLRPGVVWFGEQLPTQVLSNVDEYFDEGDVDLIMVVGTSAKVYPAAGNIERARMTGARVCVVNMDENDAPAGGWEPGDWFFKGDAGTIVPELLRPVIGDVKMPSAKA
ncbi:NAD-dependent protein deacylase [Pseudocercospora fuligena]|uniref:NAD-dependent protein deacylase n=1 Tax=Pseudocercospora fuligena TaxID=685502 RepID=A0A8H6R629_9PEZI|nr:NAD-dependent protein deacylase [Pseudocercospora fuligena]